MKVIDKKILSELLKQAVDSERKRKNKNYHTTFDDPINRMLNALHPDTYVHPHKHENPDKTEVFIILTGEMAVIEFDDKGHITELIVLAENNDNFIAEISPRKWHTIVALKETVYYEVKNGPYDAAIDKNFASWAPAENSTEALQYLDELKKHSNNYKI